MARQSNFELYDRLVFRGGLAKQLTDWRTEGHSYEEIAYRMREKGVIVTSVTVWRWVRDMEEVRAS